MVAVGPSRVHHVFTLGGPGRKGGGGGGGGNDVHLIENGKRAREGFQPMVMLIKLHFSGWLSRCSRALSPSLALFSSSSSSFSFSLSLLPVPSLYFSLCFSLNLSPSHTCSLMVVCRFRSFPSLDLSPSLPPSLPPSSAGAVAGAGERLYGGGSRKSGR